MIRLRNLGFVLVFALVASAAAAQIRGDGRLSGKVVDDKGQPIVDVAVKAVMAGQTQALQAKTNKRGEWTIIGLAAGNWELEFTKEGFSSQKGTVEVQEGGMSPAVNVTLAKAAPAVDPAAEINAGVEKARSLIQEQKFADARKVFEELLAKYPTVVQLNAYIGQTYAGEKNYDKAVEYLRIASEKDPENVEIKMLLGDILIEKGDKVEGLQILQSIDITKISTPFSLMNAAIVLINDNKPDDAVALLNGLMEKFPTQGELYYYRGRAHIAAKKMPEAKADLEKFVAGAQPGSREVEDARKILEQLKDVK